MRFFERAMNSFRTARLDDRNSESFSQSTSTGCRRGSNVLLHCQGRVKILARILAFFLVYDGAQLLPFVVLKEHTHVGTCCLGLHQKYDSTPTNFMIVGLGPGVELEEVVLQFIPTADGCPDQSFVVAIGKLMECPLDEGVQSAQEQLEIDRGIVKILKVKFFSPTLCFTDIHVCLRQL